MFLNKQHISKYWKNFRFHHQVLILFSNHQNLYSWQDNQDKRRFVRFSTVLVLKKSSTFTVIWRRDLGVKLLSQHRQLMKSKSSLFPYKLQCGKHTFKLSVDFDGVTPHTAYTD